MLREWPFMYAEVTLTREGGGSVPWMRAHEGMRWKRVCVSRVCSFKAENPHSANWASGCGQIDLRGVRAHFNLHTHRLVDKMIQNWGKMRKAILSFWLIKHLLRLCWHTNFSRLVKNINNSLIEWRERRAHFCALFAYSAREQKLEKERKIYESLALNVKWGHMDFTCTLAREYHSFYAWANIHSRNFHMSTYSGIGAERERERRGHILWTVPINFVGPSLFSFC